MRKFILLLILYLLSAGLHAQELDCQFSISAPKLDASEKQSFDQLQNAVYEFMNQRKWSNYSFRTEERIECTLLLTINDKTGSDEYSGTLNVVVRRPVYNSVYNSTIFNYIDKDIVISYVPYQPLDYNDNAFTSNLTSLLAFYAYYVTGLYFDSFTPNGGTPFFESAQNIVNLAQSVNEKGWKAYENQKNRYWLVENVLNASNSQMRDFMYKYHRLGLDGMYDKVDAGRAMVTESIESLYKMWNAKPNLYILQLVIESKRDEIINIYSDTKVPPVEKTNVVNIMKEIDPANGSKYQAILDNK